MKSVTIIIPTRNRLKKLLWCLGTIPREPWVRVIVGCDGDLDTAQALTALKGDIPHMLVISMEHVGSMELCNLLAPFADDGLLPLCDDMGFHPEALGSAVDRFNDLFPDDDGVLGLHQTGVSSYGPTGVCLMGQKFLCRYPGKRIFNPAYAHFGDGEICRLAQKIKRFEFSGEGIAVHHDHEQDQTHKESHRTRGQDRVLKEKRIADGEVWGDDTPARAIKGPPRDRALKSGDVRTR